MILSEDQQYNFHRHRCVALVYIPFNIQLQVSIHNLKMNCKNTRIESAK